MNLEKYEELIRNWIPKDETERQDQQRWIRASMELKELYTREVLSDEVYERMYREVLDKADKVGATKDGEVTAEENREGIILQFENNYVAESIYEAEVTRLGDIMSEIETKYGIGQPQLQTEFATDVDRRRAELRYLQAYYRKNGISSLSDVNIATLGGNEILEMYDRIAKATDSINLAEMISSGKEAYRMEAVSRKKDLKLLQAYYRVHGNDELGDRRIDLLSDIEIVDLYNSVVNGISPVDLPYILKQGQAIFDDKKAALRDKLGQKGTGKGSEDDPDREEIEKLIEEFNKESEEWLKHLRAIRASVELTDVVTIAITDEIISLEAELKEIMADADTLIAEIDAFRARTGEADFSLSVKEIKAVIKEYKTRLRDIKRKQVGLYNTRVAVINETIIYLKSLGVEDEELKKLIDQLALLSRIDIEIKDWKTSISMLSYDEIIRMEKLILEIKTIGKVHIPVLDNIEIRMTNIEIRINDIDFLLEGKLRDNEGKVTANELAGFQQGILIMSDDINAFRVLLENSKEKIGEERYNGYLRRIEDAEANLADINEKAKGLKTGDGPSEGGDEEKTDDKDYKELMTKLNNLHIEVNNLNELIESLNRMVVEGALSVYANKFKSYEETLETIKKEIEEKKAAGKLDENQYNNLIKKVEEIEEAIKKGREKAKDPKIIIDVDIFAFLNKRIDGVEAALDKLEAEIEALEKPIKDKHIRKQLDAIITTLEAEIKDIEQQLEKYKDEDSEKYEATKARLDAAQERLEKISKKYRSKCPLHVRMIKGAKDFYKKHKKIVLIAAGLAAIALIHATVGPILIPAIMHGNIMIGATTPALRGFVTFANNILGGLIGATKNVHGIWSLANGVIINPSVASTSLLKGLAISGVGSAMMVAPVVVAVKKLVDKMKTVNLKQKLADGFEKGKEKFKKKPKKEKQPKTKKAGKKTEEEIVQLFRKFKKSGKTIEEFCEEEELTEEDKMLLQLFEERYQKNVEAEKETGRKGRR